MDDVVIMQLFKSIETISKTMDIVVQQQQQIYSKIIEHEKDISKIKSDVLFLKNNSVFL